MPISKRAVDMKFLDDSKGMMSLFSTVKSAISSMRRNNQSLATLQRGFDKLWPYIQDIIPYDVLENGHFKSAYWYLDLHLPFRFEVENNFIEFFEWVKEDKAFQENTGITWFAKEEKFGTVRGEYVYGHYLEDEEGNYIRDEEGDPIYQDGHYPEIPYATRSYRFDFGSSIKRINIIFDTRVEGTTCQVRMLKPEKEKVDPVMELVCNDGAQEDW